MTNTQANGSFLSRIFSRKIKYMFSETAPYFIVFPEGNTIRYGQDFGWHAGISHEVKFYPEKFNYHGNEIWFIGDCYGILHNNPYGLVGKYGNGPINISINCLPKEIVEWCKTHTLKPVENDR